jgi:hypothetical protein
MAAAWPACEAGAWLPYFEIESRIELVLYRFRQGRRIARFLHMQVQRRAAAGMPNQRCVQAMRVAQKPGSMWPGRIPDAAGTARMRPGHMPPRLSGLEQALANEP